MVIVTRSLVYIAMVVFGIVSMFTTYQSLHDSILPEPLVRINLGSDVVWNCSIFALGLAVAIGLMLFALKIAIIDEQKRLNIMGVIGMTTIAFISIAFNVDVLYRWADRDFFIRFSNEKMRSVYEDYLTDTQAKLIVKRDETLKEVAKQEGELDAEIRGLREKPEGYGRVARQEDYKLTVLQKTSAVDLKSVEEALAKKEEADTLLRGSTPTTLAEIDKLQSELRVILKDMGAVSGVRLPEVVKPENPLFAVFTKLFDVHAIGIKEVFILLVSFLLDLGDIIGYTLIPNKRRKREEEPSLAAIPDFGGPQPILPHMEVQPALAADAAPSAFPEDALLPPIEAPIIKDEATVERHINLRGK
jgi:hypothetical protein